MQSISRILPSRWSSTAFFRRDPALLSLDIFGFALRAAVLDPEDVHHLVASQLARRYGYPIAGYLEQRRQAEVLVRTDVEADGDDIRLLEVAGRLGELMADGDQRGHDLAKTAIRHELEYLQLVYGGNPDAQRLYRETTDRGIPVAFVADSPLPRDLVTRMLQAAGFFSNLVLVSSHEGCTKWTGELFDKLIERSGIEPERIVHVGPDPLVDIHRARSAGLNPISVSAARDDVRHRFELGLGDRTGIDSLALALAADRLAEVEPVVAPADIAYYAGGPLAAGFTAWVGRLVDELEPDHVLFCGPTGGLLRRLTTILRSDLPPTLLHDLESDRDRPPRADDVEDLATGIGLGPSDRLLAVDLGWRGRPHRELPAILGRLGHCGEVIGAYLGVLDGPTDRGQARIWAFDGRADGELGRIAATRIEVLEALVPPLTTRRARPNDRGPYGAALPELAEAICAFAEHLQVWLRLDDGQASPTLIEPALRVMLRPTYAEAELLGRYRITEAGSRPRELAVLPSRTAASRDPAVVEAGADLAPWPEGYRALAAGDPRIAGSARRLRRGIRRALPSNQAS